MSRIDDEAALHKAYDESGQMLMHLQAAISPYDAFARSLTIGPETKIMKFRPELPDARPVRGVARLPAGRRPDMEILTLSRTINAFFRWEFNSCEALVTGNRVQPIDYANACPDIAITSLHYYFPWAIQNLVSWSIFCAVTRRRPRVDTSSREWFDIADDADLSFDREVGRLRPTGRPATSRRSGTGSSATRRWRRCRSWSTSGSPHGTSTTCSSRRSRKTYPAHEHDKFAAHFRGLLGLWAQDNAAEVAPV